jgi:MFS family permease
MASFASTYRSLIGLLAGFVVLAGVLALYAHRGWSTNVLIAAFMVAGIALYVAPRLIDRRASRRSFGVAALVLSAVASYWPGFTSPWALAVLLAAAVLAGQVFMNEDIEQPLRPGGQSGAPPP